MPGMHIDDVVQGDLNYAGTVLAMHHQAQLRRVFGIDAVFLMNRVGIQKCANGQITLFQLKKQHCPFTVDHLAGN